MGGCKHTTFQRHRGLARSWVPERLTERYCSFGVRGWRQRNSPAQGDAPAIIPPCRIECRPHRCRGASAVPARRRRLRHRRAHGAADVRCPREMASRGTTPKRLMMVEPLSHPMAFSDPPRPHAALNSNRGSAKDVSLPHDEILYAPTFFISDRHHAVPRARRQQKRAAAATLIRRRPGRLHPDDRLSRLHPDDRLSRSCDPCSCAARPARPPERRSTRRRRRAHLGSRRSHR